MEEPEGAYAEINGGMRALPLGGGQHVALLNTYDPVV
jgi:hypothetical protein